MRALAVRCDRARFDADRSAPRDVHLLLPRCPQPRDLILERLHLSESVFELLRKAVTVLRHRLEVLGGWRGREGGKHNRKREEKAIASQMLQQRESQP